MMTKIGDNSLFTDEIRYLRRELQYEAKRVEFDGGIYQFLQKRTRTFDISP
ncbi:hypothetical protein OAH23_07375 [Verrucomicrobia bacterium]|nr:hypothetical protein [Verrucomicrobiota bacterium]MDB4663672.1 hypothetical protein [Verrucomicrobiota bacterium]MDB4690222.1 hypothetical protein [Verrucomicrobiota bacterium]